MPKARDEADATVAYWRKRVASRAFKQRLAALIKEHLETIAGTHVDQLVSPAAAHALLENISIDSLDRDVLAEAVLIGRKHLQQALRHRRGSVADLIGEEAMAGFDAAFGHAGDLPVYYEALVTSILEQELIQTLLTDLIFTAIAAFNKRVNPLFGGLTTRMLEDQIKGFIRLFMPTLQQQAIAFATSHGNRQAVLDFAHAITSKILDQPLKAYAEILGSADDKRVREMIRRVRPSPQLSELSQALARQTFDDLFAHFRHKKIGDLVDLKPHAAWLAREANEALLRILGEPHALRFVATELDEWAATKTTPARKRKDSVVDPK